VNYPPGNNSHLYENFLHCCTADGVCECSLANNGQCNEKDDVLAAPVHRSSVTQTLTDWIAETQHTVLVTELIILSLGINKGPRF
jgi:hypothetical protein